MLNSVLIIGHQGLLAEQPAAILACHDWDVQLVTTLAQARTLLEQRVDRPAAILAETQLPDGNSLDLLEMLRERQRPVEWILLNSHGKTADLIRAVRLGVRDVIELPDDFGRLAQALNSACRKPDQAPPSRSATTLRLRQPPFLGRSPQAQRVRELIRRVAAVPFSALVVSGETGTGKGLVARTLHRAGSRANGPLVEVNCAALPRDLLESELFGHEPGAFTGAKGQHRGYLEQANGGTLVLDEIAEMEPHLQAKLLTAIEDRSVRRVGGEKLIKLDLQIIAASGKQLEKQVRDRTFRSDLFHRLSVFSIALPPLRERVQDLADLVPAFVEEFCAQSGRARVEVPQGIYRQLSSYHWPGNVRELRNAIERAVLLCEAGVLDDRWLLLGTAAAPDEPNAESNENCVVIPMDGTMALDQMDSHIIQTALEANHYNVTATARALGTTRETLRYRIQKYRLQKALPIDSSVARLRLHAGGRS